MSHDDKPFACSASDCGMRFSTEDHLNVHSRKHEMSLALNLGGSTVSSPSNPFLDQTPTPTKFLKNCEEIGLFQELSKNPFEEAFKKASDVPETVPLPGPHSNELNTPVPLDGSKIELVRCVSASSPVKPVKQEPLSSDVIIAVPGDKALDLSGGHRSPPDKIIAVQPSSTTSDDDVDCVSMSQAADSTLSPARNIVSSTGPDILTQPMTNATKLVTSSAIIVPHSLSLPVVNPATTTVTAAVAATPTSQAYAMQVFLQLPTGQTVPVHIPATLNPIVPVTISAAVPQIVGVTSSSSPATTSPVTTMNLKQRLKQSLAASQQQNSQRSVVTTDHVVTAVPIADVQNHILTNSQASTPTILSEVMSPNSDSPTSIDLDFSDYGKRSKSGNDDEADDRRRKFLERNRAAAARCRMKRKHWISNLERKADELQNTNTRLQTEVNVLRTEVAQLKTLLLAHKDCPITLQQKSQGQSQISVVLESGSASSIVNLPISESPQVANVVTAPHIIAATAPHIVAAPATTTVTYVPLDADSLLLAQGRSKK